MVDDLAVLQKIIDDISISLWCIEFDQPVAINCSDSEVILQFFHNRSRWRICNKAMAELYGIPPGFDPKKLPVGFNFNRSLANESFIQEIINNNYVADELISLDQRHDGELIYVMNSVRSEIHDNLLIRFWGTARDITPERRRLQSIQMQQSEMRSVLGALPDIVMICDEQFVLKGTNPAFERELGWRAYDMIGKNIQDIVGINESFLQRKFSKLKTPWSSVETKHKNGSYRTFELSMTNFINDQNESRSVLVLRA